MNTLVDMGWSDSAIRQLLYRKYGSKRGWGSTAELYLADLLTQQGWELIPQFQFGMHRVDLLVPAARAFVEVDGIYHQTKVQSKKDKTLDGLAESLGLVVFRIEETDVIQDGARMARMLGRTLRARMQRFQ